MKLEELKSFQKLEESKRSDKLEKLVNAVKFVGKLTFLVAYTGIFLYIGYQSNNIIYKKNQANKPLYESYSYQYIEIYKDKVIRHSETHEELPPELLNYNSKQDQSPQKHQGRKVNEI